MKSSAGRNNGQNFATMSMKRSLKKFMRQSVWLNHTPCIYMCKKYCQRDYCDKQCALSAQTILMLFHRCSIGSLQYGKSATTTKFKKI